MKNKDSEQWNISSPQPPKGALKNKLIEKFSPEALDQFGKLKYNLELIPIAKQNRKNPTLAEKEFWNKLLSNQKTGFRFKQQKPISNFILDFYCSELLLGIEIDGEYHEENYQKQSDEIRTEELNKIYIEIIRYKNKDVLNHLEYIKKDLQDKLIIRENSLNQLINKLKPPSGVGGKKP